MDTHPDLENTGALWFLCKRSEITTDIYLNFKKIK